MAKAVNEKYNNILRALYVKDILFKYTDENHYLTVGEILAMLKLNYGITSIRQTIYDDIDIQQISNDITELLIPVGFIALYILHITGVFRLI